MAKLISGYTGAALKARRSSDNATRDIGFNGTGTGLDTADLSSWGGSDSVFVELWYDQKNSNNLRQLTLANQPRIVNAGVYDGFLWFDGSNDFLASVNNSGTPAAITTAFNVISRTNPTYGVIVEKGVDPNTTNGFSIASLNVSGNNRLRMTISANQSGATGQFVAYNTATVNVTTQGKWVVRYDRSQSTASNYAAWRKAWKDNVEVDYSFVTTSLNPASQLTFLANAYYVGARSGGTLAGPINLTSLAIYEANRDADVATITAAL